VGGPSLQPREKIYEPVTTNVIAYKRSRPGKYHTARTVAVKEHQRAYKRALRGREGNWKKDPKLAKQLQRKYRREPDEVGCRLDGKKKITDMDQALCYLGNLSDVSKMPGKSWSISAMDCKTGQAMRQNKDSICAVCYACKGNYVYATVTESHAGKLNTWVSDRKRWREAMTFVLANDPKVKKEPYFRFFDSGDLYSPEMLDDIATLARQNPDVKFWIPTKEYKLVE